MRYELQRVGGHCGILSMISEYAFLGMVVGCGTRGEPCFVAVGHVAKLCQARENANVLRVINYVLNNHGQFLQLVITNISTLLFLWTTR